MQSSSLVSALCLVLAGVAAAVPTSITNRATSSGVSLANVTLASGATVVGVTNNSLDHFFGIPYAAPPTGDLRFRPPQPLSNNTSDINATAPGMSCVQNVDPLPTLGSGSFFDNVTSQGEDCLNLNIIRPSLPPTNSSSNTTDLPVLVFIYGTMSLHFMLATANPCVFRRWRLQLRSDQ